MQQQIHFNDNFFGNKRYRFINKGSLYFIVILSISIKRVDCIKFRAIAKPDEGEELLELGHSFTKTHLYNFDPLKTHFYIVKLGFTGYTLFFLFLLNNIDCGYSLEPPHRGGSNEYPQSML